MKKLNKDSKRTVIFLFIIFAIVIVTSIMAKVGASNTRSMMEDYVLDMQNKLDVTRAQVSDLNKEVEELKKEIDVLKSTKEDQ